MGYIINQDTYYLLKKNYNLEIVEKNSKFTSNAKINNVLNESCNYYGSSYLGRKSATKYLIGITSKAPIILNEKNNILLFPIFSPRNEQCLWFIYNNILSYRRLKKYVEITFINGEKCLFLISFNIFVNQYLKCSNLLAKITLRK